MAAVVLGGALRCARARGGEELEERRGAGRAREGRGGGEASQGGPGQSGKQEVAVRVPAGVGHARSSPSGVSWKKTRERDGLGQQCWANTVQAR